MSLRAAEVIKMLITSSRIVASKTCSGESRSWDAIITIAYNEEQCLNDLDNHCKCQTIQYA